MNTKLITKICLTEFYYPIVNSMNLILFKYGTLYSLLENLVTKKITISSAYADQICFITDLMRGYYKSKLIDIEVIKNELFYNTVLTKAKNVFLDTKKRSKDRDKEFLFTQI